MPNEIVLSETQKETVYALLNRRQEIQAAWEKVAGAIKEQAELYAKTFDVEGDEYKFVVNDGEVRLVGVSAADEAEETMDED